MNDRARNRWRALAGAALAAALAGLLLLPGGLLPGLAGLLYAQLGSYQLTWSTLAGGGGSMSGGSYAAYGAAGEIDAGAAAGGPYTAAVGFWADETGFATPTPRAGGTVAPDAFEPDNAATAARPIAVDGAVQQHNFHQPADEDWASFPVTAGLRYTALTYALDTAADTVLTLTVPTPGGGFTVLARNDDYATLGYGSLVEFTATADETWYLQVRHFDPATYGAGTAYKLTVRSSAQPAATATATATSTNTPLFTASPTPTPRPGDKYAPHDRPALAATLLSGRENAQHHWFSAQEGEGWLKFSATAGSRYAVRTFLSGSTTLPSEGEAYTASPRVDTMLFLYDATVLATWGITRAQPLAFNDDWGGTFDPAASLILWTAPTTADYYLRIANYDPAALDYGTDYWLVLVANPLPAPTPTATGTPDPNAPTPTPTMAAIRKVIDPAQGDYINTGRVSVNLPAGFLTDTVPVELDVEARLLPEVAGAAEPFFAVSIKALRTDTGERVAEFAKEALICLPYTRGRLAVGRSLSDERITQLEASLKVRVYNLAIQTWDEVPSSHWTRLDLADASSVGIICVLTRHFTEWALFADSIPLVVVDAAASPSSGLVAGAGQEVQYTLWISNTATKADTVAAVTRLVAVLPAGFTYRSGSTGGGLVAADPALGEASGRATLAWSGQWAILGRDDGRSVSFRAAVGNTAGSALSSDVRVFGANFDPVTYTGAPVAVRPATLGDFQVFLPLALKSATGGW